MKKGWSNVRASRCRAAHMVDEQSAGNGLFVRAYALCGSPIRTMVRPKGAPTDWCDHCERARERLRRFRR